ncbi:MAG: hypothetical protein NC489_46640, partial [Ruminococcus flavefaciens]|nr:hypothetical protein [Ruminococcus flavefaciens]
VTIAGSKCLVAGYGNCGSVLCQKLLALQAEVFILETDIVKEVEAIVAGCQTEFSSLARFDYIFNTVPSPIFNCTLLSEVSPDCVIIDIASKPGGTDFSYCNSHHITAKLFPGLPAKYAPKSAASILFENIKIFLRRNHVTICRPPAQTMQK